jgi:hypothetical protein
VSYKESDVVPDTQRAAVRKFSLPGKIATINLFPPTLVAVAKDKPLPQPGLWPEATQTLSCIWRADN